MEEISLQQRTSVAPLPLQGLISHRSRIIMLGSCFADSVGQELRSQLFDVTINPFGTIYNPASMARLIMRLISGAPYEESDLFVHDGLWHSSDHHSRFSAPTAAEALERINADLAAGHEAAVGADVAVLTLGTSWIFTEASSNQVVNNCHKRPAADFQRRMLTATESTRLLGYALRQWKAVRPELKVVLTVSPIRHAADGISGNSLSKAALRIACAELVAAFGDASAIYFPSYEIMLDDLRDYRYYAADMRHPSDVAVDYIYRVFAASTMDEPTRRLAEKARRLTLRASHRPLDTSAESLSRHADQIAEMTQQLAAESPLLAERFNQIFKK